MPSIHSLQQVLWGVALGLAAALTVRMVTERLHRKYPCFFAFLCLEISRSVVLLAFPQNSSSYAWIFLITQPVTWLLYVLIVLEVYSRAFQGHKGIAALSRWTLSACLVVAVGVSVATLGADLASPLGRYKVLVLYSVAERGLAFSLVLFLFLVTTFLVWFPISIRRNLVLHASLYFVYFLASAVTLFLRNVAGYQVNPAVNIVLLTIDVVCFGGWLYGFDRKGEERLIVVRGRWALEDEDRLLGRLNALNKILSRAA